MRCYIDNQELEVDQQSSACISLSINSITDLERAKTGYAQSVRIPMTARNRQLLSEVGSIHSSTLFNQERHQARLESQGCVVMIGEVNFVRTESLRGARYYLFNIIGGGVSWVQSASTTVLRDTGIDYSTTLSEANISQSWSADTPVRFLPVTQDNYTTTTTSTDQSLRALSMNDYYPFIHLATLVEEIVSEGGYTISSEFMQSDYFQSLYMSGCYPSSENSALFGERMGFLAKRFSGSSTTANNYGRIYADSSVALNSLGNFVDTADPEQSQEGVTLDGVFTKNDSFRVVGGRPGFFPTESCTVCFEYLISYTTDYRIATREALTCIDTVYLDDLVAHTYTVPNTNEDKRDSYRNNWSYQLIVFAHTPGSSYRFTHDRVTSSTADLESLQSGEYVTETVKSFSSRMTPIESPTSGTLVNPKLWVLSGDSYVPYEGDWALYNGYVEETGEVEVEFVARSNNRDLTASSSVYFDNLYFAGAEPGMEMTLSKEVTLRPIFTAQPGLGATVDFEQVAAHDIYQIHVIGALKHLFNLYFFSDTLTKTLYVEPRELFYGDHIVDWSDKIDLEREITVEELGDELSRETTLRYQTGDGNATRWDILNQDIFGAWSATVLNRFATDEHQVLYNPLFTPTLTPEGNYPSASEAIIPMVGDRTTNTDNASQSDDLNFPAKIVHYHGMIPLESGHRWGWPSYGTSYPMSTFHADATDPYTLCFEDRDGLIGLHRFYDKTFELYNSGRRISLYLKLSAREVEPFLVPNALKQDFRALFRLRIDGEDVLCRLEEIAEYNPNSEGSTRCVFLKNV